MSIRKLLILCLTFASIIFSVSLQAQNYSKLSAQLRRMVHAQQQAETRGISSEDSPRMVMLVKGDEDVLSPYCLTHQGDLHLCLLSVSEAGELSLRPNVSRIQATLSETSLCLDTVSQIVGADKVWKGSRLPQAFTGRGVLVGSNDVGYEYSNPVFRDEKDGHLRIVRAWDKLDIADGSSYNSGSNFPIGRLLTDPAQILAADHSVDSKEVTHGTLTASIAAGSSAGTPYRGIAYDADIYLASTLVGTNKAVVRPELQNFFTEELMLLTMSNIFSYADSVGQPCVINHSLGSNQDMTDCDIYYEQYLERLLTPGHILVASAGNDGDKPCYLRKSQGQEYVGGSLYSKDEISTINVSTTGPLTMRLLHPDSNTCYDIPLDMKIGDTESPSGLRWYDFNDADTLTLGIHDIELSIYSGYDGFDSTRVGYDIFFTYPEKSLANARISVVFLGKEADANIFIQKGELRSGSVGAPYNYDFSNLPVGLGTLVNPGSLPSAITVGATSHRTDWKRFDGVRRAYNMSAPQGERAYFSSCGPSLHGMMKPDVMAPGVAVASALNSTYYQVNQPNVDNRVVLKQMWNGEKEYQWLVDCGTSLSAPVVTGIIALWLQADPTLTASRIKEIFAKTCRQDDSMLTMLSSGKVDWETYNHGYQWPNYECGYGEIDAYRGLLEVLGLSSSIPTLSSHHLDEVHVSPDGSGNLVISFPTLSETGITASRLNLYTVSGQLLATRMLEADQLQCILPLPEYHGVIVVQIDGLGSTLVRL